MNASPRPCPVCGGFDRQVLYKQRFYEGVLGDGYDVVVCRHCGAGFADGIPEQDELDRYYAEQSKYVYASTGGRESEYDTRRFETIVDQVAPFIGKSASILDIGCATGGLLAAFRRRGFLNIVGADPSPSCVATGKKLYGIDLRVATLAELSNWTEKFDLITIVGVLEHLRDVRNAVHAASSHLTSSGLYYAAVPDVEGLVQARNAPFQQFSMEHVNFFSVNSLKNLLNSCGLQPTSHWQTVVEWREGIAEPVLAVLSVPGETKPALPESTTARSLRAYVEHSFLGDRAALATIDELVASKREVIVWGAGTLTRRLLHVSDLGKANIVVFIDGNRHLWGEVLAGRPIMSPEALSDLQGSILVSSMTFQSEILAEIHARCGTSRDVILLRNS